MVHELRVHQIELELQKEDLELQKDELAAARTEAEALRDRYADLYDFAPVGYATLDTQGIVREANLTGSLLLGTPRQSLIGMPFLHYVHPESQPLFSAFAHRVGSGGEPGTVELAMRAPDGRSWHAAVTARLEPVGSTGWLRLAIADVTESRRAREAAAESEERFRLALRNAPTAVFHQDAALRYTWYSSPHPPFAGTDLLGRTDAEVMAPEDAAPITALKREVLATGEARRAEVSVTAGGATTYYDLAVEPARDAEGRITGVMGVSHDITARKRAEAELRHYLERLRTSNEELLRFAYVASHDLQEPLRSIVSFSQLLERRYKGQLDADADEYIAFIVEGGIRMQQLIKDLLTFSRVETMAKTPAPTDASRAAMDALVTFNGQIREIGATVTVGPLPAVCADPQQLEQVFANLVGNAIKYRRPGVPLEIGVSATCMDGMVEFAVSDNGIGIEPEYFDRIFEMFRRLHTHDQYDGTGIGLAVVKRIVERHGGRCWVESAPGEGSTFSFTLPAA